MAELVVAGAAGRMGSRIVALIPEARDCRLAGAIEAVGHPAIGRDAGEVAGIGSLGVKIQANAQPLLSRDRVFIDFTLPEVTLSHLKVAAAQGARAVIGTTGFSPAQRVEIESFARTIPVLLSPNMSIAVNLTFKLLAQIAQVLGDDYDVEITEIHHRMKKDAPSGTALRMAEVIAQALGRDPANVMVYGRQGMTEARTQKEIGIQSLRAGDVVGEHTVVFGGLGERLELTHRAQSRDTFARGALRGARFIAQAAPGLYSMQDVLGLK